VISDYALRAFEHAVAVGDTDAIRKQWPAIKRALQHKPDYSRPLNQE
jgi:hypothetical protein